MLLNLVLAVPACPIIKKAVKTNNRKPIGLLSGAPISTANLFYSMNQSLSLIKPLTYTINSDPWKGIRLTQREKRAVQDIKNNNIW